MTANTAMQILEEARLLSLEGHYDSALKKLSDLLVIDGGDAQALRLQGNICALKASDIDLRLPKQQIDKLRNDARACYERLLQTNDNNVVAHIDLGDLWSDMDNHIAALKYYDEALALLRDGLFSESRMDELEAAHRGKISILRRTNLGDALRTAIEVASADLPEIQDW